MDLSNSSNQNNLVNNLGKAKWLNLLFGVLLLISIGMTVEVLRLQQELRQRADGPMCQANVGADCGNNGKSCCTGLTCVPKQNGNGGKCQLASVPPTSVPPTSPPNNPNPPSGETTSTPSEPGVTAGIGGVGSNPAPVQCGPNGCGWSPRPEGEKSTTNPPGVQVCTMNFDGPKQLLGSRLSSTSIRFNWWPAPGGADKQFIQYGLESGKPQWGLMNIGGNQGEIVIGSLPANRTIWAQIRAYRGNCYEDSGWVSVPGSKQVANANGPQQTVPTSAATVQPTTTASSAFYSVSPTPMDSQEEKPLLFANWSFSGVFAFLAILFTIAFMLRKSLFLLFFKKRRKKKE